MLSGASATGTNAFAAAAKEGGAGSTTAGAATQASETSGGGAPSKADKASTQPKFGDVLQDIQTKYGAKAEKPREIKKTLGKDDFMRIMVTQMKYQDPTSPFKPDQMAAQMAQFATVEQLQNMNQSMTKMSSGNQPMERLAMTGLIGKVVTIDRDRFPHAENTTESLKFNLPRDAKNVNVAVVSDAGEVVFEKDLGSHKAGEGTFGWDGLKANNLPAKTGNYMLRVSAKDARGQMIQIDSKTQAKVVGVSFEGSEPVFLVGDNKHQEKVLMKNIVKIDENGMSAGSSLLMGQPQAQAPGAEGASGASENPAPNMFTFQKGVGSQTSSDPALAQAMAQAQQQLSQGAQQAPASPTNEKGFANGLHDSDDSASAASENSAAAQAPSASSASSTGNKNPLTGAEVARK